MFAFGECGKGCGGFGALAAPFIAERMAKFAGGACGGGGLLSELELSDEQVEQIAELKQASCAKFAHAKIDLMELKKQFFRELGAAQIDQAKVKAAAQKVKEQKSAIADLVVDGMLGFAQVLTAEQRRKIRILKIRQFLGIGEEEECEE